MDVPADPGARAIPAHSRFYAMDGLRGIAAMAVVLLHSFKDRGGVPNGQLAVDLFFILSGFVIAFSYDDKLARGMTAGEFLTRRFIRLYPMLLIGAAGGIVIALIHNRISPASAYPIGSLAIAGGLSLLVLPYFGTGVPDDKAFPFNPPIWSLSFEIFANIGYALFRRWLNIPVLVVLTVGGVIAIGLLGPLDGGSRANFSWGVPRVISGFFGGVLLYKLWRDHKLPRIGANVLVLGVLITAIFIAPIAIGGWVYAPVFAMLWLTVMAAANSAPSRFDKISSFMGEASYPIYLSHWLTLYIATFIGKKSD